MSVQDSPRSEFSVKASWSSDTPKPQCFTQNRQECMSMEKPYHELLVSMHLHCWFSWALATVLSPQKWLGPCK